MVEKYTWLDSYMLEKPGAEKDYKEEWDAFRYMIRGKMFCMVGQDNKARDMLTFKLEPAFGELLRRQFEGGIVPGYYMNKEHWNSVYVEADVPDDILEQMADESHRLILASLSKKVQREILGE